MSKVEKTIQFGQQYLGEVGDYATILLVDEVGNDSKIRNEGSTRDLVCCIEEPREDYSDVALIDELTDLPIQNIYADPKGITRAAASVPNAVALSGATATPLYEDKNIQIYHSEHFDIYNDNNQSKDVKELDNKDINNLKSILLAETGDPCQYIGELKDNQIKEAEKSKKIQEINKQYNNVNMLGESHNPLKLNLVHYLNRS